MSRLEREGSQVRILPPRPVLPIDIMTTKERLNEYRSLVAKDKAEAAIFLEANSHDEVFVALAKLHEDIVPAFLTAGKRIRDNN